MISLPTMATHDGRREILALNALLSLALVVHCLSADAGHFRSSDARPPLPL